MTSLKRSILSAVALTVICLGAAARTNADSLVLTIDHPNHTVTPGTWINFTGTLTNATPLGFDIGGPGLSSPEGLVNLGDIAIPSNFLPDAGPLSTVSGGVFECQDISNRRARLLYRNRINSWVSRSRFRCPSFV